MKLYGDLEGIPATIDRGSSAIGHRAVVAAFVGQLDQEPHEVRCHLGIEPGQVRPVITGRTIGIGDDGLLHDLCHGDRHSVEDDHTIGIDLLEVQHLCNSTELTTRDGVGSTSLNVLSHDVSLFFSCWEANLLAS